MKEKLKEIAKSHTLNWYQLSDHVKASIQEAYRAGWEARGEKDTSESDGFGCTCDEVLENRPCHPWCATQICKRIRSLRMEE